MPTGADPELQQDIDEWILDYLMYTATKAVLEDFRSPRAEADDGFNLTYGQESSALPLQLIDLKTCGSACAYSSSLLYLQNETPQRIPPLQSQNCKNYETGENSKLRLSEQMTKIQ
ncbi:hypothetical protein P7C71_g2751, partial [Lecanoromycetidae sp. Uapishka_2]